MIEGLLLGFGLAAGVWLFIVVVRFASRGAKKIEARHQLADFAKGREPTVLTKFPGPPQTVVATAKPTGDPTLIQFVRIMGHCLAVMAAMLAAKAGGGILGAALAAVVVGVAVEITALVMRAIWRAIWPPIPDFQQKRAPGRKPPFS